MLQMMKKNLICIEPKLCQSTDFNTAELKKKSTTVSTQQQEFGLSGAVWELMGNNGLHQNTERNYETKLV